MTDQGIRTGKPPVRFTSIWGLGCTSGGCTLPCEGMSMLRFCFEFLEFCFCSWRWICTDANKNHYWVVKGSFDQSQSLWCMAIPAVFKSTPWSLTIEAAPIVFPSLCFSHNMLGPTEITVSIAICHHSPPLRSIRHQTLTEWWTYNNDCVQPRIFHHDQTPQIFNPATTMAEVGLKSQACPVHLGPTY